MSAIYWCRVHQYGRQSQVTPEVVWMQYENTGYTQRVQAVSYLHDVAISRSTTNKNTVLNGAYKIPKLYKKWKLDTL